MLQRGFAHRFFDVPMTLSPRRVALTRSGWSLIASLHPDRPAPWEVAMSVARDVMGWAIDTSDGREGLEVRARMPGTQIVRGLRLPFWKQDPAIFNPLMQIDDAYLAFSQAAQRFPIRGIQQRQQPGTDFWTISIEMEAGRQISVEAHDAGPEGVIRALLEVARVERQA
ncbi:hypothetical protein CKO28_00925 [Rhodovibrio sodomensis]|uniref:Uncharacterized protein n=2 Tax=Rhodovibrio sodomensis TaxID=1088 RepID=A0ABS1DB02_9PROT|nr:hypothetical protein [Rhodovibrio sodomensis]